MKKNQPTILIIFGISGDLARRYILPAIEAIKKVKMMPDEFHIVGVSRKADTKFYRMDVTDIVNTWLSGSIVNDGFILKRSNTDERSNTEFGLLKFFSNETHTIYAPTLEVVWDDSNFQTGSLSALTGTDFVLYTKGLKREYTEDSKGFIRIVGRDRFPIRTFVTSSVYLDVKYLPSSSYYSIVDTITDEVLVPFDDDYTKISCDSNGNYLKIWFNAFFPKRY